MIIFEAIVCTVILVNCNQAHSRQHFFTMSLLDKDSFSLSVTGWL